MLNSIPNQTTDNNCQAKPGHPDQHYFKRQAPDNLIIPAYIPFQEEAQENPFNQKKPAKPGIFMPARIIPCPATEQGNINQKY